MCTSGTRHRHLHHRQHRDAQTHAEETQVNAQWRDAIQKREWPIDLGT